MSKVDRKKLIGTIIGVTAFIALIAGATFAWFSYSTNNTNINGTTGCFNITYTNGQNITGGINLSASYTGGRYTDVTIALADGCVSGTATVNLVTTSATGLTGGALGYVFANSSGTQLSGTTTPALASGTASGTITATGTKSITINLVAGNSYTIRTYVWINGATADNTYSGKSYAGYINVTATQTTA